MSLRIDIDWFGVRALIDAAIREDLGDGDLTVNAVLPGATANRRVSARLVAKATGVLAGIDVARQVFERVNPACELMAHRADGEVLKPGEMVATIQGPAGALLIAERTALNFVGHLSGVATLARAFVERVAGLNTQICDTRKTTPGWRVLEKYAAKIGGVHNHRLGLYDQVLIKPNHLRAAGIGVGEAVRRATQAYAGHEPAVFITAEAQTLAELDEAMAAGADLVLLDNFTLPQLREGVMRRDAFVKHHPQRPKVLLEASGGITLDTVRAVAETGVERISTGAITHSAKVLDLALRFDPALVPVSPPELSF